LTARLHSHFGNATGMLITLLSVWVTLGNGWFWSGIFTKDSRWSVLLQIRKNKRFQTADSVSFKTSIPLIFYRFFSNLVEEGVRGFKGSRIQVSVFQSFYQYLKHPFPLTVNQRPPAEPGPFEGPSSYHQLCWWSLIDRIDLVLRIFQLSCKCLNKVRMTFTIFLNLCNSLAFLSACSVADHSNP